MSSEALERAQAALLRLHGTSFSEDGKTCPACAVEDVLRELLAEVARLERAAEHAEQQRAEYAKAWVDQQYRLQEAEAALAVAREREQRAVNVLREWVEAEDDIRRVSEALTNEDDNAAMRYSLAEPVARLTNAQRAARAALVDEPAAATLAEPGRGEWKPPARVGEECSPVTADVTTPAPGSASAAADAVRAIDRFLDDERDDRFLMDAKALLASAAADEPGYSGRGSQPRWAGEPTRPAPSSPTRAVPYREADEPARRKLGEDDPGRYEIGVLIGPCMLAEATSLSERVSNATQGYLGAAVSLTTWREDDAAAADEPGETP